MRKILAVLLAIGLVLSMSLSTAATQTNEGDLAQSTNVTAGYEAGEQGGQVISVEIKWTGMEFTYNGESKPVWDAEKHQYSESSKAGWAKSDASISITNHSNVILQAEISYEKVTEFQEMGLKFTEPKPYIGSAYTSDGEGQACEIIIRAIPTGVLLKDTKAGTKVGTIHVTMKPVDGPEAIVPIFEEIEEGIAVKAENSSIPVEERYFMTTAHRTLVSTNYSAAVEAMKGTSTPDKNLALNNLLKAFYNNLHLMQDETAF